MQVNVIETNSIMSSDFAIFPEQNPMNNFFLANQFSTLPQTLTDVGKRFVEKAKETYELLNNSDIIRKAKNVLRGISSLTKPNQIIAIHDIDGFQTASPVMQRYIMAEPSIRNLYHKQRCDGYSDLYVDLYPDDIKDKHYDYQKVMNGMIIDEKDNEGNDSWVARQYYYDLTPEDRELEITEKADILYTWEIAKAFMQVYEDITDPAGGKLR